MKQIRLGYGSIQKKMAKNTISLWIQVVGEIIINIKFKRIVQKVLNEFVLILFIGEPIRFRVTSEVFEESLPTGPPGSERPVQTIAPYKLTAAINEPGLGLLTWWETAAQGDDDENNDNQDN